MKDTYSFPGEVKMSIEEYNDILLTLNKAQKDAQLYLDAFTGKKAEFDKLTATHAELEMNYKALVKEMEDKF